MRLHRLGSTMNLAQLWGNSRFFRSSISSQGQISRTFVKSPRQNLARIGNTYTIAPPVCLFGEPTGWSDALSQGPQPEPGYKRGSVRSGDASICLLPSQFSFFSPLSPSSRPSGATAAPTAAARTAMAATGAATPEALVDPLEDTAMEDGEVGRNKKKKNFQLSAVPSATMLV